MPILSVHSCFLLKNPTGGGMFTNTTFTNKTFANGKVPPNVLAKVRWGISVITQQYYERVYVSPEVNVTRVYIS